MSASTALIRHHPLDRRPIVRHVIAGGGTVLTLLAGYALLRGLLGLAPDMPHLRQPALILHLATVMPALPLGAYLMLRPKGDALHRLLGKIWMALMTVTALSVIFVRNINQGQFSFIHLFVVLTLVSVPRAIMAARRGDIAKHRNIVSGLYIYGLLIAGAAAFYPHRTMWWLLFG